jgi:hypothetical protein
VALDWSIRTRLSQTVELNDNQFLKTSPAGSVGSYTNLATNIEARTPSSRFDFDGDGTYKKYWGPGVEGMLSQFTSFNLKGRYDRKGKNDLDREFAEASFSQQNLALALLNDIGVQSNSTGLINRWTLATGFDRSPTARDLISVSARWVYTTFDPSSSGIAFASTTTTAKWKHGESANLALTAVSELQALNYTNILSTNLFIFRNLIGVESQISSLLSFRGAVGAAYLQSEHAFAAAVAPGILGNQFSASTGKGDFIANALLTYKWMKTLTLSLEAIRSLEPNVIGAITTRSGARVGLDYSINSRSSLATYADFTRLVTTDSTDFWSFSTTYSYQFSREWSGQIGYRFLHRSKSTTELLFDPISGSPTGGALGPANSNSVMATLSRNFVVLPPGN